MLNKGACFIMSDYLNRLVEMLIREVEFIPINEKHTFLKNVKGNKTKLLEIYNSDSLTFEDINSNIFAYQKEIEKSNTTNVNVLYIKVLIFSKMPSDTIISILKNAYTERAKEKNNFACMAVCLENRNIFFSKGIIYPNNIIYDVIVKALKTDDKINEVDIMNVRAENNTKNKPLIVVASEEIIETLSFHISVIYCIFFLLITVFNTWVKIFTKNFFISFFDNNPLFFVSNLVFFLTVGNVVEINFNNRRLLAIMLIGGLFNTLLLHSFNVYSWILPIVGALMYMRYRTDVSLNKVKFIKPVLLFYLLFIVGYSLLTCNFQVIIPIAGILPSFCIAGILGFDGDIVDPNIKKNLFIIFLICVLILCGLLFAQHR